MSLYLGKDEVSQKVILNKITNSASLPDQTDHAGEYLVTDGTNASWSNEIALALQDVIDGKLGGSEIIYQNFIYNMDDTGTTKNTKFYSVSLSEGNYRLSYSNLENTIYGEFSLTESGDIQIMLNGSVFSEAEEAFDGFYSGYLVIINNDKTVIYNGQLVSDDYKDNSAQVGEGFISWSQENSVESPKTFKLERV